MSTALTHGHCIVGGPAGAPFAVRLCLSLSLSLGVLGGRKLGLVIGRPPIPNADDWHSAGEAFSSLWASRFAEPKPKQVPPSATCLCAPLRVCA